MDNLDQLSQRLQQGIVFAMEQNMPRISEALADLAATLSAEAERYSHAADASQGTTPHPAYAAPMIQKVTA